MNFVFIFGPQAVGKMTVGLELSNRLKYRLLYNHLTIDLAKNLYERSDINFIKFLTEMNFFAFRKFIQNPSESGLIYTDVWELKSRLDNEIKLKMLKLFFDQGWNVYLIELSASLETRLARNRTANRLLYKPGKRNVVISDGSLVKAESYGARNSNLVKDFELPTFVKKHVTINTENLSVNEVVEQAMLALNS